jgi:hypothetical protein
MEMRANNIFLMGYGGWGQGVVSDNATGIQPIDFGEEGYDRS